MEQIRIVGLAGSLRRDSLNRGLIRAAAESAPAGITIDVLDVADIPLFNQDVEMPVSPHPSRHSSRPSLWRTPCWLRRRSTTMASQVS